MILGFGANKPLAAADPFWSSVQFLQGFNSLADGAFIPPNIPNEKNGGTVSFATDSNKWKVSSAFSAGTGKSAVAVAGASFPYIVAAVNNLPGGSISGQFTFESSVYYSSSFTATNFINFDIETNLTQLFLVSLSGANMTWSSATSSGVIEAFSKSKWYNFAVSRDASNVCRLFVNGTLVATSADSTPVTSIYPAGIAGAIADNSVYVDEIRMTLGVCRYTASYAPSFPFPTQ